MIEVGNNAPIFEGYLDKEELYLTNLDHDNLGGYGNQFYYSIPFGIHWQIY